MNEINNTFTRLSDGTIVYSSDYRELSNEKVIESIKLYINNGPYSLSAFEKLSPKLKKNFEALIFDAKKRNIEIELLLLPYPPSVYKFFNENQEYLMVKFSEEYIINFCKKNNIKLLGSYNPDLFNLTIDDFYDGMHLKVSGIEKIIK